MPIRKPQNNEERIWMFENAVDYLSDGKKNIPITIMLSQQMNDEVKSLAKAQSVGPAYIIRKAIACFLGARNVMHEMNMTRVDETVEKVKKTFGGKE